MTGRPPIDLDSHRDAAGVMGAEMRRSISVPATEEREAATKRVGEIERRLGAPPASTLPEAVALAVFLLEDFAVTMAARDPRHATLIAKAVSDLSRLSEAARATECSDGPTR